MVFALELNHSGWKHAAMAKIKYQQSLKNKPSPAMLNNFDHIKFPFVMSQMCIKSTVHGQQKWEQMGTNERK